MIPNFASGDDMLTRFRGSNRGSVAVFGTKRRVARSSATLTTPWRLNTKSAKIVARNGTSCPLKATKRAIVTGRRRMVYATWRRVVGYQMIDTILTMDERAHWIPDHAGCNLHHGAVDDVAPDGEPPAFAARDEAEVPLPARLYEVAAHTQEDGGVQAERQDRRQELLGKMYE